MCGVKLSTKLVGRVRGKMTHTHKKKEKKRGGWGRVKNRNSTHTYAYIHARTHPHIYTQTHEHTQAHESCICLSVYLYELSNAVDGPLLKQKGNQSDQIKLFCKRHLQSEFKRKESTVKQKKKSYSFSSILPGLLLPSLSVWWDSISFLSLALSLNRSLSPFTWMLWMKCPAWLKWLGTDLSLWCFTSARCSLQTESLFLMLNGEG